MGLDIFTLGSSKTYTRESLLGGGAVVGKNVTVSSITPIDGGNRVTFSYTLDNGTVKTSTMDVMDGKDGIDGTNGTNGKDGQPGKDGSDGIGISKIEKIGTVDLVDTYRITFTDNSTFDYEVTNGKDGTGGTGASTWSEISDKPFESLSTDFSVENGELKVVGGTGGGEENKIDSISVNGVKVSVDENKNVDITVPSIEGLTKDADLATVAKSGSYEDLSNKPTIPDITGLATETYVDNKVADYTKTVDLADVATTGSYNDLADKPTIPSLDGYAKTSEIPSKVSELENDSNYLSSIPEEYVTETELSAKGYLTEHQDISGKVDKVDGKSLIADTEIARLASVDNYDDTDIRTELANKADATAIPSKVSELTNDSNYQTAEQVSSTVTTEIAKIVADAPEDLNTLKEMSDWIAGHEDDASAMNSAISDNKTAITALQTGKADKSEIPTTVSELTDSADYAKKTDLHSHDNKSVLDGITSDKVTAWDNKSDFSGSYNDLNDKPTIDAELSNTSENAIQNKVVTKEINKLYSDISFNDFDTATDGISFTDAEDGNMLVTDWTKNLFNHTLDTTTKNGVTCTNNGDGTYTLDGTASINTYFIISGVIYDKNIINKYEGSKLVGAPSGSSYESFYLFAQFNGGQSTQKVYNDYGNGIKLNNIKGYETLEIIIYVKSGKTVSNLTFKPMITTDLSATYDDFVPYSGYDIKNCGKNLLKPDLQTITHNGVTCTNNGDGTYTFNGTATDNVFFDINKNISINKGTKYKVVCFKDEDYVPNKIISCVRRVDITDEYVFNNGSFVSDSENCWLWLKITKNVTVSNLVCKPMLTTDLSATYDDFEPYTGETITVTNDTESPAFGLKSHKGITNIISPANVKCVYPTNESGKGVMDSLYNKDKMLTEQNESLSVIGKCKNLLKTNISSGNIKGVSVVRNNDGTFTLNGNSGSEWGFLNLNYVDKTTKSVSEGKWRLVGTVKNAFLELMLNSSSCGMDDGNGLDFEVKSSDTNSWIRIYIPPNKSFTNDILKPMLVDATKTPYATYDDFVPYTGEGETLTSDVSDIKKDLGGLTFSASGTTLTITDGTNTWTLEANS